MIFFILFFSTNQLLHFYLLLLSVAFINIIHFCFIHALFIPFQYTFDLFAIRTCVVTNMKLFIRHESFFSKASLEEPAYQIYILVIHLSFEPDFDWNKVNTLSIRERTCLHSMFKPCILSVI